MQSLNNSIIQLCSEVFNNIIEHATLHFELHISFTPINQENDCNELHVHDISGIP